MCQFLIGNVKHMRREMTITPEMCQFLIGNVKQLIVCVPMKNTNVCQFLIGNVKPATSTIVNEVKEYVSIPHR